MEEQYRIQLTNEESFERNSTVHFHPEKLFEDSFMNLFYGPPRLLEDQPLVVVTTSYGSPPRYSLTWIDLQPWPVFISTKEKNYGIASEPWGNKGRETASYIRFILLFWHHLPERIAFIHGHEKAWHQEGYKMSYMLRNICLSKHDYMSLSAFENNAWRPIKGSMLYYNIIRENWHLVEPYLGKFPKKGFKEKCCAQFIVSRERIHRRSQELYQLILKETLATSPKVRPSNKTNKRANDIGFFWEAIWHYIMGEDSVVNTGKKYGFGIDKDLEKGLPLSKKPERTLKHIIACPNLQYNTSISSLELPRVSLQKQ